MIMLKIGRNESPKIEKIIDLTKIKYNSVKHETM